MQNFEVTGFCWRVIEANGDSAWYPLPLHKVRKVFEIDSLSLDLLFDFGLRQFCLGFFWGRGCQERRFARALDFCDFRLDSGQLVAHADWQTGVNLCRTIIRPCH